MAAPTNAANVKKAPCQLGAVHTWPIAASAAGPSLLRDPGFAQAFVYRFGRIEACAVPFDGQLWV